MPDIKFNNKREKKAVQVPDQEPSPLSEAVPINSKGQTGASPARRNNPKPAEKLATGAKPGRRRQKIESSADRHQISKWKQLSLF